VEIPEESFDRFLQKDAPYEQRLDEGLQAAFSSVFPITDYKRYDLDEFISYVLGEPKVSPRNVS